MRLAAAAIALCLGAVAAQAEARHGISTFGDLKYPPDFKHFDYVNPAAPKGGRIATIGTAAMDTFDSFNAYILKGDAAQGLDLLFDSLMVRAMDEPDAMYGLVASDADIAQDRKSVTFNLRPEAKFSDGSALTAEDVCDSFRLISTKGHERIRITIRDVEACDVIDPHKVRYRFKGERTRDLPQAVAGLPILSRAYYAKVDFSKSTLEPPLGSGPYLIKSFKPGEYVTYGRRDDYWASDLPVNKGRYNFDEVRYDYFRERIAGFEALKAGAVDVREEFTSKDWATGYDFAAVKDGRVLKQEMPDDTPSGAQGWFFNLRRAQFQDIRVREAINLAFDFEWTNKNLFYGVYDRTQSFFQRSPLQADGAPKPGELALLDPLKSALRPEVFGPAVLAPVSNGSGQDRALLRKASSLLDAAGWKTDGTLRRNAAGQTLDVEFLIESPVFERVLGPYVKNLRLIGINATIRTVDDAQYLKRLKDYDYDVVGSRFVTSQTPGDELRVFFGSESANSPGSYNLSGLASPAIDALLDKVVEAPSRDELNTAGQALDRVLRAEQFWVPNWYKGTYWLAYWDRFGRPETKPKYDRGILDTWWYDEAKAKRIANGN
ncbi:ABC transporter substrate-binding protein [Aestuariivirga litoralis]|uniref:ABC transporter substrate-binding protein n=1 Tax=Aestuariivirga litoralis TaxID=2650924 RepID=A0A2W2CER7_9HYPH|nr:extracellular solute-binding protein [Aestuariivirga litoralis]PZF78703.1 ABC transporter substrate-binding protein [Aestuariivirga litoralis]